MNPENNMTLDSSSTLARRSHGSNSTFDSISDLGARIRDSLAGTEVVLATNEDHRAMTPEELERFGTIYEIKDSGEVVETTGAKMAAERRARAADIPTPTNEAEVGGQDDSVTEIISPEAARLNAERAKLVNEAVQRKKNAAEKGKKRAGAEERARRDQAEKEEHLREEVSRKKAEREKRAMQKAAQEMVKRVERAEQARKTKEARKAAAERRRNFGAA